MTVEIKQRDSKKIDDLRPGDVVKVKSCENAPLLLYVGKLTVCLVSFSVFLNLEKLRIWAVTPNDLQEFEFDIFNSKLTVDSSI